MSVPDDVAIGTYYSFQASTVAGSSKAVGITEGWAAPISVFEAPNGFGEEAWVPAVPVTTLATWLGGAAVTWCGGGLAGRTSNESPSALQPKGSVNHSHAAGAVRFSQIYFGEGLINRVADAIKPGAFAAGGLRDDLVFCLSRNVESRIADYLSAALTDATALEMEARSILLIGDLLRAHHGFAEPAPPRGGLAPWQLRRATDAIQAHLHEDIGLDMLAAVAGCSPAHFSRAFKQSTGVPPFLWLLERRVARAKEMLADQQASLAEVALAVGFSAQPQFTTAFKRVTGTTPGAWRRSQLPQAGGHLHFRSIPRNR